MLRIGICDDEELITKRLMRILYSLEKNQSENYDIEVYTDSVKLSEKLSAGKRYDLIFLDIMMPVKSGVEVGKIIRNDLKDNITQIVFISSENKYAMDLFEIRPMNFLIKPFYTFHNVSILLKILVKISIMFHFSLVLIK